MSKLSRIKKSTIIKEFREQVRGRSSTVIESLDKPFFKILNLIFKKQPLDVKLEIGLNHNMTFRAEFENEVDIYLEHFYKKSQHLLSITQADLPPEIKHCSLTASLTLIESTLS